MKRSIYYFSVFITVCAIVYGGIQYSTGITGITQKNGDGCVCHDPVADPTVTVRIWGPTQVLPGSSNTFTVSLKGGPAVKGGFNAAVKTGSLTTTDPGVQVMQGELTHTTPRVFGAADSVYWTFSYTAPGTLGYDTLYATSNSVNGDGQPTDADSWNNAPNFAVQVVNAVPVELTSFVAKSNGNSVLLSWETATELNNDRFEVQRSEGSGWSTVATVKGNGTTTAKSIYNFTDKNLNAGNYSYRLKQIDFSGQFEYSQTVEVEISAVNSYALMQNYPNPFNPETVINFAVPAESMVKISVYNSLGEIVSTLVNQQMTAGNHQVKFDASKLSSGLYFYKMVAGEVTITRKMVLSK